MTPVLSGTMLPEPHPFPSCPGLTAMPEPATTVSNFCLLLQRSQLLTEAEVQHLRETWERERHGRETEVDSFRQFLVQKKRLTEYQAALIQRGRAEGFQIGGYIIQERLGKGATAGVYRALHPSGQQVALKVLPPSKARDAHALQRFQREGRLLTRLNHPNIVRAFQVGQEGEIHFIIMEHLDGETLEEVLNRRKKIPPAEAARLIHQALLGLQHLHEHQMVHRDLKPSNLMLIPAWKPGTPDTTLHSTLKILDIGIGRQTFSEEDPTTRDMHLTTEGALLGTPDYLAPEQARDSRAADIRSDIYSLGCVFYQLLTGRTPYIDANVMTLMVKHSMENPPPINQLAPGTPLVMQTIIETMMAKKPENRYPTPQAAAAELARFLPENAAEAKATTVLPAYQDWLDSESGAATAKPPHSEPQKRPGPRSAATSGLIPKAPAATSKAGPPSGKFAVGSGTVPALASAAKSGGASSPRLATGPGAKKTGKLVAAPPPNGHEEPDDIELLEVELVSGPPEPPKFRVIYSDEDRPLTDLTRRDFIMLGIGATGVILAIGMGYGLARLLRPTRRGLSPTSEPPPPAEEPAPPPPAEMNPESPAANDAGMPPAPSGPNKDV